MTKQEPKPSFSPRRSGRTHWLQVYALACACFFTSLVGLCLAYIIYRGSPTLSTSLFFGDTAPLAAILGRQPIWDGIWPACAGTLSLVATSLALAIPPGVAAGIYLAEFPKSWLSRCVGPAIDILAGIPSILMGLFGFTLIITLRSLTLPTANTSLLLSGLCIAMLILPYLASTTRTALLAIPSQLRLTATSLGFNQWQAIYRIYLPQCKTAIISGIMLATGRAAEDTAVIMLTGAVANAGMPAGLLERYEALPFTIYYYSSQYQSQQELNMVFGAALTLLIFTTTIFTIAGKIISNQHDTF